MLQSVNPLLPTAYDLAWTAVSITLFALLVVALISIARSANRLTGTQALAWTLLAIFAPVVRPLAWLFIGRRSARSGAPTTVASRR